MKRILVLCSLYFVALSSYADTCPEPQFGYIFRVAAWGNHIDPVSQVRCHYYYRSNENIHYEYDTPERYSEHDMDVSWPKPNASYRYTLCVSDKTNVNECQFHHA